MQVVYIPITPRYEIGRCSFYFGISIAGSVIVNLPRASNFYPCIKYNSDKSMFAAFSEIMYL